MTSKIPTHLTFGQDIIIIIKNRVFLGENTV